MKGRRRLSRITLWLLAATALGMLAIAIIVNSETASRGLLRYTAQALGIESGQISGTLAAGIRLEALHYHNDTIDISIDTLNVDWEPWALLYGSCTLQSLRADRVRIRYTSRPRRNGTPEKPARDFSLPLRIALGAGEIYDLQVEYDKRVLALDRIRLDGALSSRLTVNQLLLEAPAYRLTAQAAIDGAFPHAGELALQWRYSHATAELAGKARLSGDIKRLELEHNLSMPATLKTTGHILTGIDGGAPHMELHNLWSGLQPPFTPFPITTDGELHASGWLGDYRLQGQGKLESAQLPPLSFALAAGGDRNGLHSAKLQLKMLQGTIGASGSLRWLPAFKWRTDISAADIDLRSLHPRLPESLRLDLQSTGARTSGQWRGSLDHIRGSGSIGSRPLRLQGALEFAGSSLKSPGLELAISENSLSLSGRLDRRRLDARWRLRAPRLSMLWPDLGGELNSAGHISGERSSPHLKAALNGHQLAYDEYRVGSLDAGLETENAGQYALTVAAERISFKGHMASAFTLSARGNAASHHIESRIQDDALGAAFAIDGAYRNKGGNAGWRGQLLRADVQPAGLPAWSLQQPMDMAFGAGSIHLEAACWSAAAARICMELAAAGNGVIHGTAGLAAVPAELLDAWLGPRVTLSGLIDGKLNMSGNRRNPAATLELEAVAGTVGIRQEGMPANQYRWDKAFVRAELRDKQLSAITGLAFPGYGEVQGKLAADLRSRRLDSDITARFHNLAPLQTLIPNLGELSGDLQASVKLSGTLDRPAVAGSLLLTDAAAQIPRLGIRIHGLKFDAHADPGGKIAFQGTAGSGTGNLQLDGTLAYGKTPALEARVKGADFEILHLPTLQARISPSLDIRAGPGRMNMQGTIQIPSAQINIKTLPESAVTVSQDAILVDEAARARRNDDFRFSSRLQLVLGDDVQFQGFGFNAGLDGQLVLNKRPDRLVAATNGELRIKQGQYKAFGQQLDIERGRLLFQGPYDNPGLDIVAVRQTTDVSVSLEIGGTLENPQSRVYSEPPLPDSEAMAILLTGKPLGSASASDANMLVNAVTGLGLKKGKFITDDIARTLNLDEFNIKSEGDVSSSELFIGKRISPRLFIRYIVGLFDQTSRIGLSYQLSRHLKLEAESGWAQSMDLIYEIER